MMHLYYIQFPSHCDWTSIHKQLLKHISICSFHFEYGDEQGIEKDTLRLYYSAFVE